MTAARAATLKQVGPLAGSGLLPPGHPICKFHESDIEDSKQEYPQGHEANAEDLLQLTEDHRTYRAAHIGRSHLHADGRRTVALAEVQGGQVLNGWVDRPHAGSDDDEAYGIDYVPGCRKNYKQNSDEFDSDTDPDEFLVPELVGNEAGNEPAQHQTAEDQGAKRGDGLSGKTLLRTGEVGRGPQETGGLSGTVGKEGDEGQHDPWYLDGLGNSGTFRPHFFLSAFILHPEGNGQDTDCHDAELQKGSPSVAVVPMSYRQGPGHDERADDRSHSIEAVEEINS